MSYCRFGPDSDVYLIESTAGFECCGCDHWRTMKTYFKNRRGLLKHLRTVHRADKVPREAIRELRRERWMWWTRDV